MDCRMKNSKLLYQANIGPGFMSISNFGSKSKCVNVSDTSHNKSVACMHVECEKSGRAYYVSLPERFGKINNFYKSIFIKLFKNLTDFINYNFKFKT
jgi:hypothetical protein